jgi:hypothetical protein
MANDGDVVESAAGAWADLVADHDTVNKMAETLDDDLPLVRKARVEITGGAEGLSSQAVGALAELTDLLAAGDLLTHRGEIKELTNKVSEARREATTETKAALTKKVEALQATLRDRFPDMDGGKVDEALRPLEELLPPDPEAVISLADLRARVEVADTRSTHAAHVLEELQGVAGNLARVKVSEVVTEPITSEEELDTALGRIRQVSIVELAEGKQVRLQ